MRNQIVTTVVLLGTLLLAGCANNPYASNGTTADTTGGALAGALAGAVIGNQTGSPLAGAAIGAGLGGLAGYAVSHGQETSNSFQPGYNANLSAPPPCPVGYTCTPQPPPPPCPPGYTCTPNGW